MVQCPQCQADVQEDFGLVTCRSCGHSFFIGVSGETNVDDTDPTKGVLTTTQEHNTPDSFEQTIISDLEQLLVDEDSPQSVDTEYKSEKSQNLLQEPASPENFSDIESFGNSSEAMAFEGLYRYDIFISGIDSQDLRRDIADSLTDSRFLWDVASIISSIKEGQLALKDLPAVKAYLVVQRLKILPISIRWEQKRITDSPSSV